ncbi:hypothetical protein E4T56_gene2902 [Termitomyces sp. T112]|nr:hypothetical protein E4T56_gene2902 [Termitomyces sp. T112]
MSNIWQDIRRDTSSASASILEDVFLCILKQFSIREVSTLSQVNKQLRVLVHEHIAITLDHALDRFGFSTIPLFTLLHQTRSLISGSFVLVLLNPWSFYPHDLDIYIPQS